MSEQRYDVDVEVAPRFRRAVDQEMLRGFAGRVLAAENVPPAAVGIVVTNDATIRDLNRHYRGEDAPTDVLSFALNESTSQFVLPPGEIVRLGEVVISLPTARRQAKAAGHSVEREVALLLVHGLLHLLGYGHVEAEEERAMRAREVALLSSLGVV